MKRITLLTALFLCCWQPQGAVAQNQMFELPSRTPVTPSAGTLAKAVSFPVSHSTGLVDIKIPLYEVVYGDIIVPIYLTYHGSGIKVREPFGWVGAGWRLVAEPQISRTVQGLVDEKYYFTGYFDLSTISSISYDRFVYDWLVEKKRDLMPDHFFYQLPDRNGGFYFEMNNSSTRKAVLHPYEPIKIDPTVSNDFPFLKIDKFTIRDEKGFVYGFGNSAEIERTRINRLDNGWTTNTWKGNYIRSENTKKEITFSYFGNYTVEEISSTDYVEIEELPAIEENHGYSIVAKIRDSTNPDSIRILTYTGQLATLPAANIVLPTFTEYDICDLLAITFGDYFVFFNRERLPSGYYKLKNIQVRKGSTVIRQIDFTLSKLGNNTTDQILLKLDNIQIYNPRESGNKEVYTFNYYDPDRFPSRNTRKIDYWGYSNDDGYFFYGYEPTSLVPKQRFVLNYGSNRDTIGVVIGSGMRLSSGGEIMMQRPPGHGQWFKSAMSSRFGSLKEIIYPTGGKTEFIYEVSRFENKLYPRNSETFGGGLRIKQIIENPGVADTSKMTVKTYHYSRGKCRFQPVRLYDAEVQPYGLVGELPEFLRKQTNVLTEFFPEKIGYGFINKTTTWKFLSDPLIDLTAGLGAPIVYDTITEYINNDLKTVYHYDYFLTNTPPASIHIDSHWGWRLGKLKNVKEYKKTGNSFSLLREKQLEYIDLNNKYIDAYMDTSDIILNNIKLELGRPNSIIRGLYSNIFSYLSINLSTGCYLLSRETETLYDDHENATLRNQKRYFYNDSTSGKTRLARPVRTQTAISTVNEYMEEALLFPHTITGLSGAANVAKDSLKQRGIIGTLLGKDVRKITENGQGSELSSAAVGSVRYDHQVLPGQTLPQLTAIRAGKNSSSLENRVQLSNYTANGKPMYMLKDKTEKTVWLWGYKGEYLIAEIKNATYDQVKNVLTQALIDRVASASVPSAADLTAVNNLRSNTGLSSAQISTYTYQPLVGLETVIDPRGVKSTYVYDSFGRLQTIRDENGKAIENYEYHYKN